LRISVAQLSPVQYWLQVQVPLLLQVPWPEQELGHETGGRNTNSQVVVGGGW